MMNIRWLVPASARWVRLRAVIAPLSFRKSRRCMVEDTGFHYRWSRMLLAIN
jgi:hypothetical protein